MDLIALDPVRVVFEGLRERSGPLTLGQLNMLEWMNSPGAPDGRLDWVLDLTAGTRVSDVAETFAVLLARHEGLRTSWSATDPPMQRVAAEGELVIEAYAVAQGDLASADGRSLTIELLHRLRRVSTKESDPLPLQVALVLRGEQVLAAAALSSHLALDIYALGLVGREFAELVRDPRARVVGPARYQPLDQAEAEQEPRTVRRVAAAIEYWERQLERMPTHVAVGPRNGEVSESVAVVMTSPTAGQALDRIALRTRMSRAAIAFAAVCAVLSQHTGYERWSAPLLSGNRFEPLLSEYVGTVAGSAVVDLDLRVSGFDELIGRITGATITAYRHGVYDIYARRAAELRIGTRRGVEFCREPLFNHAEGSPAAREAEPDESQEPSAGAGPTRLDWTPSMPPKSMLIRFDTLPAQGALKLQCWTGDSARTSRTDMESLLLAVERVLVAAAEQDLDLDQMRQAAGLEPMARGEDWLLIDYCWIELSEVQRLLDDALPSVAPRIFRSVDGRALVAYVPAGPHALTPEEAHVRCMAELAGRPSAMTPRWYVICDGAAAEPADILAWQSRTVLAQGPGRAP